MSLEHAIPGLPPAPERPTSVPEEIFRAFRRGEMPEADYFTMTAVWVSDNVFRYAPREYPRLPEIISGYVNARAENVRDWDEAIGKKLGDWIAFTLSLLEDNRSNWKSTEWAAEKLRAVGLGDGVKKLEAAMERFRRVDFNRELFDRALMVQRIDAIAAQNKIGRGRE